MDFINLTCSPLKVDEVTNLVSESSCGAISVFIGTTRDNFEGNKVLQLEYTAYDQMAESEIKKICSNTRKKWVLKHIAIYHRIGIVPIKDASVIIAVSSEHRQEALSAVSFIIDALKSSVPIWKKEIYQEGEPKWKENKECIWSKEKLKVEEEHRNMTEERVIDPSFVQITAPKEEVLRRIEAFQKMKRDELNVLNIQEFCSKSQMEGENSCARTSAVVLRPKGAFSHLKVTKVVNKWGPQTEGVDPGSLIAHTFKKSNPNLNAFCKEEINTGINKLRKLPQGIEERLCNMEDQLNMEVSVPPSVYERLKNLEDRIIHLESLSPEYFSISSKGNYPEDLPSKLCKYNPEDFDDSSVLRTIDVKLFELKAKMKNMSHP